MSGFGLGLLIYFLFRAVISGWYTVDQNERAVKTSFGRATRWEDRTTLDDAISRPLKDDETDRIPREYLPRPDSRRSGPARCAESSRH